MRLSIYLISAILLMKAEASAQTASLRERLEQHVRILASDSLEGRGAGTQAGRKAADYIAEQLKEVGIEPFFGADSGYFQSFYNKYRNIIGVIEGSDPLLKDEYIVVGAHYDHLGTKMRGVEAVVYNGADDNASGSATLIELSRELKALKLGRSIIIAAFDAEELGLYGSSFFALHNGEHNIVLMLSIDMVGRYNHSGHVEYEGVGTLSKGRELLLDAAPKGLNVKLKKFENSVLTATDTEGFAKRGIPTLAVTTGLHRQYHKPTDDADLLDYDAMALITEHLKNFVVKVSEEQEELSSGKLAAKHKNERPIFTKGLTLGIGSNYHSYSKGALDGKTAGAYSAGLTSQLNFGTGKRLALRPELLYEYIQAEHPEGKIKSHCFTAPLSLVLQTENMTPGFGIYAGGYYRHYFNKSLYDSYYPNEAGLNLGFDASVGPLRLSYVYRRALTDFNRQPVAVQPFEAGKTSSINNVSSYFNISFSF